MSEERNLLAKRLAMESLISQREMMKAANDHRAMQGYSQAYGEESFDANYKEFLAILENL